MTNYESTQQAGTRTGLAASYIRRLAQTGRIAGAEKIGKTWLIPQDWTPPQLKRGNPNWTKGKPAGATVGQE